MLLSTCGKAAGTVAFPPKEATHILHEVLRAKGFKVNTLVTASLTPHIFLYPSGQMNTSLKACRSKYRKPKGG